MFLNQLILETFLVEKYVIRVYVSCPLILANYFDHIK